MSDYYNDRNRNDFRQDMQPASRWVSLVALAVIVGAFVLIGMFAGSNNQTATNVPAVETTGAAPVPPGR